MLALWLNWGRRMRGEEKGVVVAVGGMGTCRVCVNCRAWWASPQTQFVFGEAQQEQWEKEEKWEGIHS